MTWNLAQILVVAAVAPTARPSVLIAVEPGVDAYVAAIDGLTSVLRQSAVRVVEAKCGGTELLQAIAAPDLQAVVAVGGSALADVRRLRPRVPVIATMVLSGGDQDGGRVELEIPLTQQLETVRELWPGHTRVAILRHPARSRYSPEALEMQARKAGFTALIVDCDGPARLLQVVVGLRGKADFLFCFPDPDLFNPVTVKPLVLAALDARLPIVGFSPAFVRAGAAVGVYPNYRDIGRQTGEMVLRRLSGDDRTAIESPRKLQVALNQRIARLLGAVFNTASLPVEMFR